MERVNFSYSLKNIPIPSRTVYLKNMIFKLESFTRGIRWKAFFYEKLENTPEKLVVKSVKTTSKNEHLNAFEADLCDMVRNIEFKTVSSEFQIKLSKDIKRINEDPLLFIPADKTSN